MRFTRPIAVFPCLPSALAALLKSPIKIFHNCRADVAKPGVDIEGSQDGVEDFTIQGDRWLDYHSEGYHFVMRGHKWHTPRHCMSGCLECIDYAIKSYASHMQCHQYSAFGAKCWVEWMPSGEKLDPNDGWL